MNLHHIELHVHNPHKSKEFYEQVLGWKTDEIQGDFIWMKVGSQEILLRPGQPDSKIIPFDKARCNFVLCVPDLEKTVSQLKSKGLEFKGVDMGDLTFTDPDGNWFQLIGEDQ